MEAAVRERRFGAVACAEGASFLFFEGKRAHGACDTHTERERGREGWSERERRSRDEIKRSGERREKKMKRGRRDQEIKRERVCVCVCVGEEIAS